MKGWTEDEFRNKALMAPCGLYCGACGVYIATRDGNDKFKSVMANLYGTRPEETECLGCMQTDPAKKVYAFCQSCPMRACVKSRGYYSCHQCGESAGRCLVGIMLHAHQIALIVVAILFVAAFENPIVQ